jgi:hypothetical protein
MKPSALWIVFRNAAYDILGAVRLSGVRVSPSKKVNQLLLSPANPPVGDVVISTSVVNGGADIESFSLRHAERDAIWFSILVQVVVSVAEENRQCGLKFEGHSKIDDHAGPSRVVAVGQFVEFRVGDIDAPHPPAGARVGFRPGRRARRRILGRVLTLYPPRYVSEVCVVILVRDLDGGPLPIQGRMSRQADQQPTAHGRDECAPRHHLSRGTAGPYFRARALFKHPLEHAPGNPVPQALTWQPFQDRGRTWCRRRHGQSPRRRDKYHVHARAS